MWQYCNLSVTFSKYYVHVLQRAGEYCSIKSSKNIDFLTMHCFEFSSTMYIVLPVQLKSNSCSNLYQEMLLSTLVGSFEYSFMLYFFSQKERNKTTAISFGIMQLNSNQRFFLIPFSFLTNHRYSLSLANPGSIQIRSITNTVM